MAEEKAPPPPTAAPAAGGEAKPKEAAPQKLEATDASGHPWVKSLSSGVPEAVVSAKEFARQVTVVVKREKLAEVAR